MQKWLLKDPLLISSSLLVPAPTPSYPLRMASHSQPHPITLHCIAHASTGLSANIANQWTEHILGIIKVEEVNMYLKLAATSNADPDATPVLGHAIHEPFGQQAGIRGHALD